jgi:predicted phage tail protein
LTFEELLQIVESNARAIQAVAAQQVEFRADMNELRADLREEAEKTKNLRVSLEALRDIVGGQNQRINQLVGYSVTGESDRLDLEQRIRALEDWKQQQGEDRP